MVTSAAKPATAKKPAGTIGPLYHGTRYNFDKFKLPENVGTEGLGIHFGTLETAEHFVRGGPSYFDPLEGSSVRPVYLKVKKPLRLPDMAQWLPQNLADGLADLKVITTDQQEEIVRRTQMPTKQSDLACYKMIRKWLDDAGYDAVVYKNEFEGSGDSYIVWHPQQIVSALTMTAAAKSIWYHGTLISNLRSILTQGLVPEGVEKNWATDPQIGITAPSRQSYGGIYVTQNLMTAVGAPENTKRKAQGGSLVVIMELQPNTMYLDEDDITGALSGPIQHMSDIPYQVLCYYLAGTEQGAPEEWQKAVKDVQETYKNTAFSRWESKFVERKLWFHPELEKRLESLMPGVWVAAITRSASHITNNYDFVRAWDQVFYGTPKQKQRPDINDTLYTPAEGEKMFRDAVEQVMRTLRVMARPQTEELTFGKTYNLNTARITEPIGYSGSNHILAVVEVRDSEAHRLKQPVQMIVRWGTVPQDFFVQWDQKYGSKYEVQDARMGQPPKAQGATASKTAAKKFYHASTEAFEPGTILVPSGEPSQFWEREKFLEDRRPKRLLPRSQSVFMTDNPKAAKMWGRYVYEVEPLGKVEKNDIGWFEQLLYLDEPEWIEDEESETNLDEFVAQAAKGYWSGKPNKVHGLGYEYRTPQARIVSQVTEWGKND